MTALVSISPSYPTVSPIFCLCLKTSKENTQTQESSEVIRDMERELNVETGDVSRPGLLSLLVHKLLLLTDIVLEVQTSLAGRTSQTVMCEVTTDCRYCQVTLTGVSVSLKSSWTM